MANPAEGFLRVLAVFDRLEIPYLVGGSVASSVHGISRPTMDVDLVADLRLAKVGEFCEALQSDFYADPDTIQKALKTGRPFNIIHLASTFKIDIFPLRPDTYSQTEFSRRRFEQSNAFGAEPIECAVATPEDTILRKLEWFRAGGETSERQWNDLRGVLKINRGNLDLDYLVYCAKQIRVSDLLDRLLLE